MTQILAELEANAHLLNDTVHQIETVDKFSIQGVRSVPCGDYAFAMQAALNELPELKTGLRELTLKVVEQKIEHDPSEADRQMALARYVARTIQEIKAELDARKATADPDKWEALNNELDLFQDFARLMFADVLRVIDAARTNRGF